MAPLDPLTVYTASQLNTKHLDAMQVPLVHQYNKGTGIKVGIVSLGIQPHAAFRARLKGGYDFTTGGVIPATGGQDPIGDGTALAGLVAGNGVPFKASVTGGPLDLAIQGISPECWLYDLRVADSSGTFTTQRVIDALNWAVTNQLDVLLLAVGWESGVTQGLIDAVANAAANNILMVAPIGSVSVQVKPADSPDHLPVRENGLYPARGTNVIGVGAVNVIDHRVYDPDLYRALDAETKEVSPGRFVSGYVPGLHTTYFKVRDQGYGTLTVWKLYTKRSDKLEIVAPGGYYGIGVTKGTNDLCNVNGSTLYACGYIAGILALALSNGLTPDQARARLREGVIGLGNPGWDDTYGWGLPNAVLVAPPRVIPKTLPMSELKGLLGVDSAGYTDPTKVAQYAGMSTREFYELYFKPKGSIDLTVPRDATYVTRVASSILNITPQDQLPYLLRYPSPGDGETNVPVGNPIRFILKSDTVGIDIDTVMVKLNNEVYKRGDPGFSYRGDRYAYEIEVRRGQPWDYEETVTVEIEAWDLSGRPGLVYERVLN